MTDREKPVGCVAYIAIYMARDCSTPIFEGYNDDDILMRILSARHTYYSLTMRSVEGILTFQMPVLWTSTY